MEAPARTDATAPVADEQLAALREEIRRGGRGVVQTRRSLRWLLWTPTTLLGAFVLWGFGAWLNRLVPPWPGHALIWALSVGPPFLMLTTPVLFLLPTLRRWVMCRRLVARSRAVPIEELRNTLLPLVRDPDPETRRMAAHLLRNLSLPTELTPAGTPEGSGAEVSGAPGHERR